MPIESALLWSYGCVYCSYGVRDEYYTAPTGGVELVLERLVAAEKVGPSYFCDCQAGTALRNHLHEVRERYLAMTMRLGPHKDGKGKDEPMIEHLEIGKVILSMARATMSKPWMQIEHNRDIANGSTPTVNGGIA